jgi:tetratricopeptide (TPR) repeat protein
MRKRIVLIFLVGVFALCLAAFLVYQAPAVHERLAWRLAYWQAKIQRFLNPPEALVFVPGGTAQPGLVETIAKATLDVLNSRVTASPPVASLLPQTGQVTQNDPGPAATVTPQPSFTPAPTSTPLPGKSRLSGIVHEYQQFNNCGPANLAMALSFWGWQGDQRDTRAYLRPNLAVDDKNVNPAEMVAYVEQYTRLAALTRLGGDLDLLRSLLAAGYPVLIEAGHDPPDDSWMGHYLVVSGYNDELRMFTLQDSLTNPDVPMTYADLTQRWWRDFNYVYLVIYPKERQVELERLLGPRMDESYSYQLVAQRALDEITRLQGRDLFFAWFNLGSSQVGLADYAGAAQAYDKAFELYQTLSEDLRPYRLMWYQVGPYQAYYNTGRYQDVINLANTTFTWASKPVLEESYYWRGMAYLALGKSNQAIADLNKAAALNPNYAPPRLELERLGIIIP